MPKEYPRKNETKERTTLGKLDNGEVYIKKRYQNTEIRRVDSLVENR